jgi:hypothetical protein
MKALQDNIKSSVRSHDVNAYTKEKYIHVLVDKSTLFVYGLLSPTLEMELICPQEQRLD